MLQYSVPPAFSSPLDNSDLFRPNDRLISSKDPLLPSRLAFSPSISSNLPSSPALSSSLSTASSKLPRSPYISSRQLSSPVDLPSARLQSRSHQSRPASIASAIDDVFFPGDVVGEGQILQNEPIRLVSIPSVRPPLPEDEEPAGEFEVIRRLGAGSYAVVYLVREVLYRAPPSIDGHMSVEMDDKPRLSNVYGREYAIKCLSKANLDEEALAAQMSEVRRYPFFGAATVTDPSARSPFTNLLRHTQTLSPIIGPLRHPLFYFCSWNTFQERISFIFWNKHAITTNLTRPQSRPLHHGPPQHQAFSPTSILRSFCLALVFALSRPCSRRCVMPSQPATPKMSIIEISSPKTSLSRTAGLITPMVIASAKLWSS